MTFTEELAKCSDEAFIELVRSRSLAQVTHALNGRNRGPERKKVRQRAMELNVNFGDTPSHKGTFFRVYDQSEPSRWSTIRKRFVEENGYLCSYNGCEVTNPNQLCVHHINSNKLDNRRSNLQVLCHHHHNIIEGKTPMATATRHNWTPDEKNTVLRIASTYPKNAPNRWQNIQAAVKKELGINVGEDAIKSRIYEWNRSGDATIPSVIQITRDEADALVNYVNKHGITITSENYRHVYAASKLEATGFFTVTVG